MLHVSPPSVQIDITQPVTRLDFFGAAQAEALIGDDVQKGLSEVRRLHADALACYAVSNRMLDEINDRCRGDRDKMLAEQRGAKFRAVDRASDKAGHRYHYALLHMLALPVRTLDDVRDKTLFAIEQGDYTEDENIRDRVLKQIAAYFRMAVAS